MLSYARISLALFLVLIVTIILLPLHLVALKLDHPLKMKIPGFWHRAVLRAIGVKVSIKGQTRILQPTLIVANHASWLDILVLSAAADVVFVAKSEVRGWPVFGLLARLQRTVFIDRDQPRRSHHQANEMAARLNRGEIVVLFPEGTTSDGNRLLLTKSTLFASAIEAARDSAGGTVFVQPTAVAYTKVHGMPMGHYHRPLAAWPGDVELLPHLVDVLKIGAIDAEVNFGRTIAVDASTNRKRLAREAEAQIRELLEQSLRGATTAS